MIPSRMSSTVGSLVYMQSLEHFQTKPAGAMGAPGWMADPSLWAASNRRWRLLVGDRYARRPVAV